jgi:hypothetical protein
MAPHKMNDKRASDQNVPNCRLSASSHPKVAIADRIANPAKFATAPATANRA